MSPANLIERTQIDFAPDRFSTSPRTLLASRPKVNGLRIDRERGTVTCPHCKKIARKINANQITCGSMSCRSKQNKARAKVLKSRRKPASGCHLHAKDCNCPAYLIAMGANDAVVEADLEASA